MKAQPLTFEVEVERRSDRKAREAEESAWRFVTWGLLNSILAELNDGGNWEPVYRLLSFAIFALFVVAMRDARKLRKQERTA